MGEAQGEEREACVREGDGSGLREGDRRSGSKGEAREEGRGLEEGGSG